MAERYVFGWTDYRGMYRSPKNVRLRIPNISTEFMTNFMGMVIIMIPVSVIAYWIWF